MSYCYDCKQEIRLGGPPHTCPERRLRIECERLARTACSVSSETPETNAEWTKHSSLNPSCAAAFVILCGKLERERDAALDALDKIESFYVDGDDTYEAWKAMGEVAATFLAQNR